MANFETPFRRSNSIFYEVIIEVLMSIIRTQSFNKKIHQDE